MEQKPKAGQPKRQHFTKEIPLLMYGFGDVEDPLPETCDVMESILLDYLSDICGQACLSSLKEHRRLKLEDFKRVLSNDPKKLARIEELLFMFEDIRKAKLLFDQDEVCE